MDILGVSCFNDDSAACLLRDGDVIAAAQEERFSREKYDSRYPRKAIKFCLSKAERAGSKRAFRETAPISHHLAHAASSFFCSPFEESAILVVDGKSPVPVAAGLGKGSKMKVSQVTGAQDSLGLFYNVFTGYLGFDPKSDDYKVMGLAAYGKPRFYRTIKDKLISIKEDGAFEINMKYFYYQNGLHITNGYFKKYFDGAPEDIAASVQKVTEEALVKLARGLYKKTRSKNLCLSGEVALNCVANARLLAETPFKDIFIQPASGDAGAAIGCAKYIYHEVLKKKKRVPLKNVYLGPAYSNRQIKSFLTKNGILYEEYKNGELTKKVAGLIAEQKIIGWFQGEMEFGPRALGNRSILADPRNPANRELLNKSVKHRESFRPFAPSVLEEEAEKYFDLQGKSPYMLLTAQVKGKNIPAATHIDGSARVQTVSKQDNALFYSLIKEYEAQTGVAALLNTSFNGKDEPIVCSPEDAYKCFMGSKIDHLVMGDLIVEKKREIK